MTSQYQEEPEAYSGKPEHRGMKRLLHATRYSLQGLRAAWKHEEAFRLETMALLVLFPASFVLAQTLTETVLLLITLVLVLVAELANSAIEAVVDRIGMEQHPLSGRSKDLGSAMVFVALMLALLVWLLVLIPRISA